MTVSPDDLRAAVAAGIISEAHGARLEVLAHDRAGRRAAMPHEDEPFAFFRGFSGILAPIGLAILPGRVAASIAWFEGGGALVLVPLAHAHAGVAWWLAEYLTLRRRMTLPPMVLATAFGAGVLGFALTAQGEAGMGDRAVLTGGLGLAALAIPACHRGFRLPFAAFLTAGIVHVALLSGWAAGESSDFRTRAFILIAPGGLIPAIGIRWVPLCALAMKALPNFPCKNRLPPYSRAE